MSLRSDIRHYGLASKSHGPRSLVTPSVVSPDDIDKLHRMDEVKRNPLPGPSELRHREREEIDEESLGTVLRFDREDYSPYLFPLDGGHYDVDPPIGPRGTCPLCNNAQAKELNEYYIHNLHKKKAWGKYGFEPSLVLDHLVSHIGLVYGKALEASEKAGQELSPPEQSKLARRVAHSMLMWKVDHKWRKRAEKDLEIFAVSVPLPDIPRQEVETGPSVYGRPKGAKAKQWYAYDGRVELGQLRPWEDKRVEKEMTARANDAIVFYDEMLDVRHRARRVYDEIMDNDPGEGVAKNYSAAVAAVREIKGVAMDMAKLALIATKYGDDADKQRQISPSMKAMLDEIGIFQPADEMKQADTDE